MIWTAFGYTIQNGKFDLPFADVYRGTHDRHLALEEAQNYFGPLVKVMSVVAGIHTSSYSILPSKEF